MMAWPTPPTRDHKSGLASAETMERNARPLSEVAAWSTPRASDGEKGGPNQSFGAGGKPLPSMAAWATPRSCSAMAATVTDAARAKLGERSPNLETQIAGATPNGSGASSTSGGGGSLSPDFVTWMMGYPPGWLDL